MEWLSPVLSGLIGGVITGVAAVSAIRVELRWLRRDNDRAHARLDDHEKFHHARAADHS